MGVGPRAGPGAENTVSFDTILTLPQGRGSGGGGGDTGHPHIDGPE